MELLCKMVELFSFCPCIVKYMTKAKWSARMGTVVQAGWTGCG